jgi:hypothetical protein
MKILLEFFLTVAIILLFLAGLLAATKGTFDLHVHDRYLLVLPTHLLVVSAAFFITTFVAWKARVR